MLMLARHELVRDRGATARAAAEARPPTGTDATNTSAGPVGASSGPCGMRIVLP